MLDGVGSIRLMSTLHLGGTAIWWIEEVDSLSILGMVLPLWGTPGLDPTDISGRDDLIQNLV